MSCRVLVFLQQWSRFTASWLQMVSNQGLFFRLCTPHCKKRASDGGDLTSHHVGLPKTDFLHGALVLQSIKWVNVMKSGSQCPARFNVVNFPGKLKKTTEQQNQSKEVKPQFFGRKEKHARGIQYWRLSQLVITIVRPVSLHPQSRRMCCIKKGNQGANYWHDDYGLSTLLPTLPSITSILCITLKTWFFGKPSSCRRKVMYVRSMHRKGLLPGLISMVLHTKEKEKGVWMHTVGSGLASTQLWKTPSESIKHLFVSWAAQWWNLSQQDWNDMHASCGTLEGRWRHSVSPLRQVSCFCLSGKGWKGPPTFLLSTSSL